MCMRWDEWVKCGPMGADELCYVEQFGGCAGRGWEV